jgi:hypothetical protein
MHKTKKTARQTKLLDEIRREGYSDAAYKNEPEGVALASALSVQVWMNCFHLPRGARTRWVTERIASAQAD